MSDIEFDNEHPKNVMEWQRENSPFTNLVFVQSTIFKSPYFNKKKPVMEEFGNNFQSPVGGSHVAGKKGKKGKKESIQGKEMMSSVPIDLAIIRK